MGPNVTLAPAAAALLCGMVPVCRILGSLASGLGVAWPSNLRALLQAGSSCVPHFAPADARFVLVVCCDHNACLRALSAAVFQLADQHRYRHSPLLRMRCQLELPHLVGARVPMHRHTSVLSRRRRALRLGGGPVDPNAMHLRLHGQVSDVHGGAAGGVARGDSCGKDHGRPKGGLIVAQHAHHVLLLHVSRRVLYSAHERL